MVKGKQIRAKAAVGAGKEGAPAGGASAREGRPLAGHQQRKLQRKVAFLEKLSVTRRAPGPKAAGVQKKKKRRPSAALSSLGLLADTLQASADAKKAAAKAQGTSVGTLKARTAITNQETARMQQVLAHPQFKSNPIAAITSHLSATLPPPAQPPKAAPQQRRRDKKKKAKAAKAETAAAMAE